MAARDPWVAYVSSGRVPKPRRYFGREQAYDLLMLIEDHSQLIDEALLAWQQDPDNIKSWHRRYHSMTDFPASSLDSFWTLDGNWMVSLTCSVLMTSYVRQKGYANVEACGMFGEGFLTWLIQSQTPYAATAQARYIVAHAFLGIVEYNS